MTTFSGWKIAVGLAALLLAACGKPAEDDDKPKQEPPTVAERFSDRAMLSVGELAGARLSFVESDRGPTKPFPIEDLGLPQHAKVLSARNRAIDGLTVGELVDGGLLEPLDLNCSTLQEWENETRTFTVDVCVPLPNKILPSEALGGATPTPSFEATFARGSTIRQLCYRATIEVTGIIRCENSCNQAAFVCTFLSDRVVRDIEQPSREPDTLKSIPCGPLSTCGG